MAGAGAARRGRARAKAAVAALGLLAAVVASAPGAARAEPCTPVLRLSGDPALVEPVLYILGERGVRGTGTSPCGAVTAALAPDGARVRVTLTDADGRAVVRIADDAEMAATILESWARRDVAEPLLAARPGLVPAPPPRAVTAVPEAGVAGRAPRGRRVELGAAVDVSASGDGGLWTGARAHLGLDVGAWHVGAVVRVAADAETRGAAVTHETSRSTLDVLAVVERPLGAGRWRWRPGVSVGQSTLNATRGADDEELEQGLVVGAHLGLRWRIAGAWSLGAELGVAAAPFMSASFGAPAEGDLTVAGAPRTRLGLGLGLVYGGL